MRLLFFALVFIFSANMVSAQDIIVKLDGERINCTIVEIKTDGVSYYTSDKAEEFLIFNAEIKEIIRGRGAIASKRYEDTQDVIVTKDNRAIIVKIGLIEGEYVNYKKLEGSEYVDGKIAWKDIKEILEKPIFDQEYYETAEEGIYQEINKKQDILIEDFSELPDAHFNNLKMSFTGIGNGSIVIGYERVLGLRVRAEALFQSHGTGIMPGNIEKSGFGIELGIKYKMSPPVVREYSYDNHFLHGAYIKAGAGFSTINEQIENLNNSAFKFENVNRDYFYAGLDLGYQWVFVNRFTMDVFMGINYFTGSFESSVNQNGEIIFSEVLEFEDGDLFGDNNVAVSAGLHIGYLFSIKK